jgi:hypothetical protein
MLPFLEVSSGGQVSGHEFTHAESVFSLYRVIPNSIIEARVFFSARVGVRDLLLLFELSNICEIDIANTAHHKTLT